MGIVKSTVLQKSAYRLLLLCVFFLFAIQIVYPVPALASDGAEPNSLLSQLVWPLANFSLFVCLAVYLYRRLGPKLLDDRSRNVSLHLRQARESLEDAQTEYAGLAKRRDLLEDEKLKISVAMEQETREIIRAIEQDTERSVIRVARDADRKIHNEQCRLEREVRETIVSTAVSLARIKLESAVTADIDRELRLQTLHSVFAPISRN